MCPDRVKSTDRRGFGPVPKEINPPGISTPLELASASPFGEIAALSQQFGARVFMDAGLLEHTGPEECR